jgi:hypothetical protein
MGLEPELNAKFEVLTVEALSASLNWICIVESSAMPVRFAAGVTVTMAGAAASGKTVTLADALCVASA